MRRLANSARRRRSKKIRRVVSRGLSNTKSLSFDGTNDKATWAANTTIPSLIGAGDFSISYWIKAPDFTVTGSGYFGSLIYSLYFSGGFKSMVIGAIGENSHASDAGLMTFQISSGSTYYTICETDESISSVMNNNAWNHVLFTSKVINSGTQRQASLFINGASVTLVNDTDNAVDFSGLNFGDVALGAQTFNMGADAFDAYELDEISMYNKALTSSDATEVYNSGVPADETSRTGLVGYWRLEGNGDDSSTNSNSLTISGATFTSDVPS